MKLNIKGDLHGLEEGISLLSQDLEFELHEDGIPVVLSRRPGDIRVLQQGERISIAFERDIHFFRGLGLLVEALSSGKDVNITETPQFDMLGAMIDVSRNGVMKTETVKDMLRKMAIMGLDTLMLYTEDTYEIPGRPYFGYMRGRYTQDELREYDQYAAKLGIEMIPCIQALAHLTQALKWNVMRDVRDTEDILLAEHDATYEFIEEMMKAASAPVRSKRIHIGMDEAHMLGLGRYLQKNGYKPRFDIMLNHLNHVVEMAKKLGLEPMIWSDMFFRLGSATGDYYDMKSVIPQDVPEKIPGNVELVYWDYYHYDRGFYKEWIKRHRALGTEPIFAGGCWTWTGFCTGYDRAYATTNAALSVCKEEGVKEVFTTLWYDNGAENNYYTALPALQYFAEHGYAAEVDNDKFKDRFRFCNKASCQDFEDLELLNKVPGAPSQGTVNPSKYLLWQDPILGLFDSHVAGRPLGKHYSALAEKLQENGRHNPQWDFLFDFAANLSRTLALKADIGVRMVDAYKIGDLDELGLIAQRDLPELLTRIQATRDAHRHQWFTTNKPFGWETIDIRYGGLYARVDSARWRLTEYIEGRVDSIPELEEPRLSFSGEENPGTTYQNVYRKIAAVGVF